MLEWKIYKEEDFPIWNMKKPTLNDGFCSSYEEAMENGLFNALNLI